MIYDEERNCYTLTKLEENCIKLHIENENLQKKLDIAAKALKAYAKGDSDAGNGCLYETPAPSLAQQALKEIDLVGTSVSLADNKIQASTLVNNKLQAKEEV